MPAKDLIHNAVKNALIKDGWTITADPYELAYQEVSLAVDLAAEKLFEATRDNQKILIEVKSFVGRSFARDFQTALGQYQMYLGILEVTRSPDTLYLAISDIIYRRFFRQDVYQMLVERFQIQLLIVDIEKEEIISWIS
jgi:hypothetical protein